MSIIFLANCQTLKFNNTNLSGIYHCGLGLVRVKTTKTFVSYTAADPETWAQRTRTPKRHSSAAQLRIIRPGHVGTRATKGKL